MTRSALGDFSSRSRVTLEETDDLVTPRELDDDGEFFAAVLSVVFVDSSYSHRPLDLDGVDACLEFFRAPFYKPLTPPPFTSFRAPSSRDTVLSLPIFSTLPHFLSNSSTHTHHSISVFLTLSRHLFSCDVSPGLSYHVCFELLGASKSFEWCPSTAELVTLWTWTFGVVSTWDHDTWRLDPAQDTPGLQNSTSFSRNRCLSRRGKERRLPCLVRGDPGCTPNLRLTRRKSLIWQLRLCSFYQALPSNLSLTTPDYT